jgi:RNA polymerase sigma-70 factor (ECF subfamily)
MHTTSLSLLARLQAGSDSTSWQRLVNLYQPLLRGWMRSHSAAPQDADDLIQEVFVVLLRELPEFRHSGHSGAFRAWLRGILVNRLRELWRAGRGRPTATGDSDFLQLADQLADPDSILSRHWDTHHDQEVLSRLLLLMESEFETKTILAFRRVGLEGARPREVATELGMSVGAVYVAKSCVLRRLREEAHDLIAAKRGVRSENVAAMLTPHSFSCEASRLRAGARGRGRGPSDRTRTHHRHSGLHGPGAGGRPGA